jgi:Flp pilus assembly pilin Flp
MAVLVSLVNRLVVQDDGQDLIEYGLLVALVAIVAIAGVSALGNVVNGVMWRFIAASV